VARERLAGTARLQVDDWLLAGYSILAEEGVKSLKIERLCAVVGATRGSFYWHFADIQSYRDALVSSWSEFLQKDRRELEALSAGPPRERLSKMMALLVSPRQWMLERAMREWARSDAAAAAAVRSADRRVLRTVRKVFTDYGFEPDEARLRADTTFAAGIGLLHLAGSAKSVSSKQRERILDLMLRR
jgi:AcrR family transcriptional regulator